MELREAKCASTISRKIDRNSKFGMVLLAVIDQMQNSTNSPHGCIHGGADLMAHGRQEGAFGAVGVIGLLLGGA